MIFLAAEWNKNPRKAFTNKEESAIINLRHNEICFKTVGVGVFTLVKARTLFRLCLWFWMKSCVAAIESRVFQCVAQAAHFFYFLEVET